MKLSADNVTAVFNRCLSEAGGTHVQADGVVTQAEFDPARLNEALPEIESMLDQLSDDFKEEGGGGMSFLRIFETWQKF
jgi:hypothetical protein